MAAEIVAVEIPMVGAVAPMVADPLSREEEEVEVDSVGVEVEVLTSQASLLNVLTVETPAPFLLNQTVVSRFSVATASDQMTAEVTRAALIASLHLDDSMIDQTIDQMIAHDEPHQDQLR